MRKFKQYKLMRSVLTNFGQFALKKQQQCLTQEREAGDCWIGVSLANTSGLILAARVGKHTDALIEHLVSSTQGKTDCKQFNSDEWGVTSVSFLPNSITSALAKHND